jgi:nucleoid-associated protein YgaU
MTRLQTLALFSGQACVILLGGLAWYAYAPNGSWANLFPSITSEPPQQAKVTVEATQPEKPAAGSAAAVPVQLPEFDVVRVEPTGESVIAGHSRPDTKVSVMVGGRVLAEASADASGHFVVTPLLPPGDQQLSLRDTGAALDSTQSVTVSVPRNSGDKVVVALAEPGKPTIVLGSSPPASLEAQKPGDLQQAVAFITAEVDRTSFYATGKAGPNARLRIYADSKPLADVTADAGGRWSLRVSRGIGAGRHKLRADDLDTQGKVLARVEIPFDVAAGVIEAKTEQGSVASGATKVQRGDNLWRISHKLLGDGLRYTQIYEANSHQIRDPNLIYPGQVFILPK